jgi:hypothetical protein
MRRDHYEKLGPTLVVILITISLIVLFDGSIDRPRGLIGASILLSLAVRCFFKTWGLQRADVYVTEAIKLTYSIEEASVRDDTKSKLALSLAENPRTPVYRTLIAKIMKPR